MSIVLVLLAHMVMMPGVPRPAVLTRWVDWGAFGVQVFFVVSGYLITTLLLAELDRTGRVSLGRFSLRRSFRIFPSFYVYLVVVAVLAGAGVLAQSGRGLAYAAAYLTNYVSDNGWYAGHTWSLAVEEQFYLIWPAALVAVGRRRGWVVAAVVAVVCPVLRVLAFQATDGAYGFNHRFETTADFLAVGCLLAFFHERWWAYLRDTRVPPTALFVSAVGIAVLASSLSAHPHVYFLIAQSVACAGIAVAILVGVHAPECSAGRVLNGRLLRSVGVVSYSLYLWQQLFLGAGADAWGIRGIDGAVAGLALSAVAAVVSYVTVERASHGWRDRALARLTRRVLHPVASR